MPEDGSDGKVVIGPAEIWEKLDRLEKRFEQFKWQIVGGVVVVSSVFGVFGAYLTNYALGHR